MKLIELTTKLNYGQKVHKGRINGEWHLTEGQDLFKSRRNLKSQKLAVEDKTHFVNVFLSIEIFIV